MAVNPGGFVRIRELSVGVGVAAAGLLGFLIDIDGSASAIISVRTW
jgi:hypothetical protein